MAVCVEFSEVGGMGGGKRAQCKCLEAFDYRPGDHVLERAWEARKRQGGSWGKWVSAGSRLSDKAVEHCPRSVVFEGVWDGMVVLRCPGA